MQNLKKATKIVDGDIAKVQAEIDAANEKMKDREQDDDTVRKIVFASCIASMIGGATLGGIFGQTMVHFIGGGILGTVYGTIFVSLLAANIHEAKPVAKMVQSVKKFFLKRKLEKLEERQEINKKIEAELAGRI
jgi:hypothetical protein